MAGLRKVEGRYVLQFTGADKRRRTIRLGKLAKRDADSIKSHVETIIASAIAGQAAPDDTARWLSKLPDTLYDKLAAVGLTTPRERATLGAFISGYIDKRRTKMKPATIVVWGHTHRNLVDYFGAGKPLSTVTPGDADQWALWLSTHEGLALNTIRKRCQFAKMFFRAAVRHKLIPDNPFADLKGNVQTNPTREYFITRDEAAKVLDACPDTQWRLVFALSRFGGFRCPSEHLALSWADVNWELDRMTVRSPKTEHHDGGESRVVPLFPELRPFLEAAFDEAEPGTVHVVTRYRDATQNLRTQLLRIIDRAGLNPWPKLFQNLRATRETELAEQFPLHVVCAWIGNSAAVAKAHYLQVTDDHYQRAAKSDAHSAGNASKSIARPKAGNEKTPGFPGVSSDCDIVQSCKAEGTGLEPATP